jgi:hypothetical protein
MQASYVAGNQRGSSAKQKLLPKNYKVQSNKSGAALNDFWPSEPEFIEQPDSQRLEFDPADRSIRSGSTVQLHLKVEGAYDIEWHAFTPIDEEERVVGDDGSKKITDKPIQDTVYQVCYKTVEEVAANHHGSVMRTRGHRIAVYFSVVEDETTASENQ